MKKDNLIIAKKKFKSRLIVGTGKYKTMSECAKAIKLSGAEIVTVAVRRVNISDKNKKEGRVLKKILKTNIYVKEKKYFSRIRIEDLAIVIKKMFFSSKRSMTLNVADDKPSTNIEVP